MRHYVICFLLLLTMSGAGRTLFAAPITFNTALPVAQEEGLFRIQSVFISSSDDPGHSDRELTVVSFPLVGGYGITGDLAVFGIVPLLYKSLELDTPDGRRTRGDEGLGDISVFTRYTIWQRDLPSQTVRIAPFTGVEIPTGEDDEKDSQGRLPQPLQLGSGSWDPFLGVVGTWQTLNRQIDASLSYTFNTRANNFQFGDVARFDLSYQHRLWPQQLGIGVPSYVYGVLENNLIWQDRNEVSGKKEKDSGGTAWFLSPGIQYVTKRMVIETAVSLPVIQDLNGDALKNDFTGRVSFRINF